MNELKPCPFCGRSLTRIRRGVVIFGVSCDNGDCGADGPIKDSESEAILAWNTRAALDNEGGEG